jgi:hypothetical protein
MRPNKHGRTNQHQNRRKQADAKTASFPPIMPAPDEQINQHENAHLRLDCREGHNYPSQQVPSALQSEKGRCEQESYQQAQLVGI